MLLSTSSAAGDMLRPLLPWVFVFAFVLFFTFRRRRSAPSFVVGARHGRLPVVVNSDGTVPETTVVALQPSPAYEACSYAGSAGQPPFLTVTAFLPTPVEFLACRRADERQRGLVWRAATLRPVSGDEAFDRQFEVIGTTGSEALAAAVRSPAVRAPLQALFSQGFGTIRSDGKGLDAIRYEWPPGGRPDAELLSSTVRHLQELAEAIQAVAPEPGPVIPVSALGRTMLLAAIPIALGILLSKVWTGAPLLRPPWYLLMVNVAVGLPPMLLLGVVLGAFIKRRSDSSTSHPFLIIASLIGSYFFGDFGFRLLNSRLDRGSASVHVQRVVGWRERGGDVHVAVTPWDGTASCVRVPVDIGDCERVMQHDADQSGPLRMEIVTRPGFLYHTWIESYRLLQPESRNQ